MKRLASLALLALIAATLPGCGSSGGEGELMRRVAQAEEAANKAEASAKRAEAAAASIGAGRSNSDETPSPAPTATVVEDGSDVDPNYGKGEEPVPLDG
ncbi:hypothetical protein [Novosphingobium sp. Gsoil 351]|uniref:hypothetical protein n=1 Tax=Novosphingobium sp. Gsoil 351 TaxID=2675225 RepID=UPI0012B4E5CD|nr:hypothetical protein [Novosphingobium sp. Gsoil 351]QGN55994.1 hypothetical protein GKE62_17020 [Novosphingobium sp. Gsoil 351]